MGCPIQWLRSLKVGDVVTIKWRDVVEDVTVVRAYNPRHKNTTVHVKRKHLVQLVYLRPYDKWVSCRFSNHQGNEHLDFSNWLINHHPHTLVEGQGV